MQRNRKLTILIVLITAAIFVWIPKGRKTKDVSSTTSAVTLGQVTPVTRAALRRKRTEFVNWARDPFARPRRKEEEVGSVSNLSLSCIIWNDKDAQAFINESIVRVGDKITDKTVKQIERNRVILTDGTKDYILELRE
jgi:hypothetical protein